METWTSCREIARSVSLSHNFSATKWPSSYSFGSLFLLCLPCWWGKFKWVCEKSWCSFVFLFLADMEKEEKSQRTYKGPETDFFLQWGNRKRLRCVRVKDPNVSVRSNGAIRRKITSRIDRSVVTGSEKESAHLQPSRFTRWENPNRGLRKIAQKNEDETRTNQQENKVWQVFFLFGVCVWLQEYRGCDA